MNATEESLRAAEQEWQQALEKNEAEKIAAFMAEDWVIIGTDGGITGRDKFMKMVTSGDLLHDRMDSEEMRVRVYGDSGVVTNLGTSSGTWKGAKFSFYEWSTSMFIHTDLGWKCVLTMLTPAKKS